MTPSLPGAAAALPTELTALVAFAEEERAARAAVIDDLARRVQQLRAQLAAHGLTPVA